MSKHHHIILIGFMGAGKSSVSKALSAALDRPLIETDALVCERAQCATMHELFSKGGETLLRQIERQVITECDLLPRSIISTGGGIIDLFNERGHYVIFLHADFQEIVKRLKNDRTRPLFSDLSQAKSLYEKRLPLYCQHAQLTIDTNGQSVDTVTQAILEKLPHGL